MNVSVLALEGVFDTGLSVVLDALSTANELVAMLDFPGPQFNFSIVGMRPQVNSAHGFRVPVSSVDDCPTPELIILPALGYKLPAPLLQALGREDIAEAVAALRSWAESGTRIAAACIGTFVLAETGLLDHHEATTTWWLTSLFRQRYPAVLLNTSRMVIDSGQFITAGAALSHLDMMLGIIRQISPQLATLVASYLVVDSRPSQAAYIISDHLAHSDPLVERFDRWVREHIEQSFDLELASRDLATSKRTLTRHVRNTTDRTPVSYVQDLRIERAVHLLKTSSIGVDEIAQLVGYADGVTLRNLLRRRLGKGIREIKGAS